VNKSPDKYLTKGWAATNEVFRSKGIYIEGQNHLLPIRLQKNKTAAMFMVA
jgi:hypothetical protein